MGFCYLQTRKRVLINAFTVRALRDTFAPARIAGTFSLICSLFKLCLSVGGDLYLSRECKKR